MPGQETTGHVSQVATSQCLSITEHKPAIKDRSPVIMGHWSLSLGTGHWFRSPDYCWVTGKIAPVWVSQPLASRLRLQRLPGRAPERGGVSVAESRRPLYVKGAAAQVPPIYRSRSPYLNSKRRRPQHEPRVHCRQLSRVSAVSKPGPPERAGPWPSSVRVPISCTMGVAGGGSLLISTMAPR